MDSIYKAVAALESTLETLTNLPMKGGRAEARCREYLYIRQRDVINAYATEFDMPRGKVKRFLDTTTLWTDPDAAISLFDEYSMNEGSA